MADRLTPELRSANMRQIRSVNTKPELTVRRLVHRLGFRFRLHRKDLPGAPDLVLPRLKSVILVHGCFWHGHGCKRGGTGPKTNKPYWGPKIEKNMARDQRTQRHLRKLGWRVLVVWECDVAKPSTERRLVKFLNDATSTTK